MRERDTAWEKDGNFRGKFRLESMAMDKICARIIYIDRFPKSRVATTWYRGTSLIRNFNPPRTTIGP